MNMNNFDMRFEIDELRRRIEQLEEESSSASSSGVEPCTCDEATSQTAAKHPDDRTKINLGGETAYPVTSEFREAPGPIAQAGALRIRATIDYTRTDNGFLGCVYARYRATSNTTVLSHASTLGARNNLSWGSEGWSIIVGHGAPGIIVTGTGQVVDGIEKFIARSNERYWRPILSRGVIGAGLTLFGCEVGAGSAGSDLLRRVASAIRKPVGAWTGNVWCSNTSVWGTGTFVTVRPGVAVAAEEVASMYSEEREPLQVMRLASHAEVFEEVRPDQITSVQFTPVGSFSGVSDRKAVRAERSDALSILQRIDLENPFITEDKPGAIHVGMLNVSYGAAGGQEEHTRTFRVLGSSLIQDVVYPDTYYYASQELQQLLR